MEGAEQRRERPKPTGAMRSTTSCTSRFGVAW